VERVNCRRRDKKTSQSVLVSALDRIIGWQARVAEETGELPWCQNQSVLISAVNQTIA
jgi:hypothetical protein